MVTKAPAPAKPPQAVAKDEVMSRSFFRDDFPLIRKSSILLASSILASAALVVASGLLLSKQKERNAQAQTELAEAQGKYKQTENEKNEIRDFLPRFQQLTRRGFIGDEKRLDTIERIRQIQESRKLLPIKYEIFPQQAVALDPSIDTGQLELRSSKMMVRMGLLHEMDLFNFLGDLRTAGFFNPQTCTIKPINATLETRLSPRLNGECTLFWVTMGRRPAAEGETPAAPATATAPPQTTEVKK
ncbi:hypothetical protein BH11PSE11_BH11PSE11_30750 [soil metagenome]